MSFSYSTLLARPTPWIMPTHAPRSPLPPFSLLPRDNHAVLMTDLCMLEQRRASLLIAAKQEALRACHQATRMKATENSLSSSMSSVSTKKKPCVGRDKREEEKRHSAAIQGLLMLGKPGPRSVSPASSPASSCSSASSEIMEDLHLSKASLSLPQEPISRPPASKAVPVESKPKAPPRRLIRPLPPPTSARKKCGVTEPFPDRLHRMLRDAESQGSDVISFSPDGSAIVIANPKGFACHWLPKYFKQSRWASFRRQLSGYGFVRRSTNRGVVVYSHPLFHRDRPKLCEGIVRKNLSPAA